jgi:tetratricopeptide (TPR) repeat protein
MLDDRERQLVFRLTPSAFDDDRAFWGQSLGMAYWQRGEPARARAYADSALAPSKSQAEGAPQDAQLQVLYGLALALAGKPAEARASLAKALALNPSAATQFNYILLNGARIETILGNKDRAAEYLEAIRKKGGFLTPQFLSVDPTFASLKGNARFEKLLGK